MTKPSISRAASLLILLALTSTAFGWIPFHSDFTIHSVPEGATVYKDGQPIGTTPYKSYIFLSAHNYEIRLEGFYNKKLTIDYSASKHIHVKMRATPILVQAQPNADIYATDAAKPFGKTPIKVDIYPADRTYILKAKDHYDQEITLGLQTKTPLTIHLKRRPIITLTAPAGVEIYENGKRLATGTLTEEILKPRTFELRKEGFYSKTIELTSASPACMNATLLPLPIITIQTTPADATISLIGKSEPLGTGTQTLTIEKATAFEVKANRYYSKTFTLEPKTQTANIELDAMPYVTITSDPAGAEVLLDGTVLGTTPLEQLIEKETTYQLRQDEHLTQTVTLNGKDAQPIITLEPVPIVVTVEKVIIEEPIIEEKVIIEAPIVEETPVKPELNLPLIGGIAAAVLAIIIAIIFTKKKKA